MTDDQITAALDQLAAQREQITRLDTREATHYATLTGLFAGLTAAILVLILATIEGRLDH